MLTGPIGRGTVDEVTVRVHDGVASKSSFLEQRIQRPGNIYRSEAHTRPPVGLLTQLVREVDQWARLVARVLEPEPSANCCYGQSAPSC